MPPRWPRKPTRQDPEFRKLDDRYTFAAHIAVYLTLATGLEFFNLLWQAEWSWLVPFLGWWGLALGIHAFWIIQIARYPQTPEYPQYTELDPTPKE
jgi:hypothetical protein